ncbi:hypothetical protein STENM327S_00299 [Streptomyces tendae]
MIHERLVQDYGVTINYQRVKLYLQVARPRIADELGISPGELAGLHRRFEVVPGAQAQVDWGDEGKILAHVGIPKVYSFHMTLSYSRDPFCCFTTSQDLATFFDCHRAAFAHFGGVPTSIVYDRTKTVVRRHVAPGEAVPLHPEAVAFAGHYDFDIDVLAAYRPQGKGRGRAAGRHRPRPRPRRAGLCLGRGAERGLHRLGALAESEGPRHPRRGHRTPGRARSHRSPPAAADSLRGHPRDPAARRQGLSGRLRRQPLLGARKVRPRQLVEIRATKTEQVSLHATVPDAGGQTLLAVHPRAVGRGARVVDETHWAGLPTRAGRRVTTGDALPSPRRGQSLGPEAGPLQTLLNRTAAASVEVGRRPLSVYDELTGTRPFTANSPCKEAR